MAIAKLICRGLVLDQHYLPPFEVHAGELVAIHLPAYFGSKSELIAALTGSVPTSDIEIAGSSVFAWPAQSPIGWRRWFSNPSPAEWLIRHGFSHDEALAMLTRLAIETRFRLDELAANPRTLLGLVAAIHRQPGVVVFDPAGLDPMGERAVQELVQSHLQQTSVMYFSWPAQSMGTESYRVFPGSTVVELTAQKAVTV